MKAKVKYEVTKYTVKDYGKLAERSDSLKAKVKYEVTKYTVKDYGKLTEAKD